MERDLSPPPPPYTTELDEYIYDYLIKHNLTTTAAAFLKETEAKPFANDLQKIDVPGGFLSDWWSIFWPSFISSPGDLACLEEQKALEAGNHFSKEEHIQQRAATFANSNRLNDAVFNHTMQQDPTADSAQMNSQKSHHLRDADRRDLPNSPVYKSPFDRTAPRHMPQQYQQPADEKCADDMLDLSGNVTRDITKKTMGIIIEEVLSLNASSKKIFCCNFSSDGALLAGAGDENKVFIWNLRNNLEQRSWEAHSSFITDISFRPNETMLATASSDKTVRLWDASQQGDYCVETQSFTGHNTQTGKAKVRFHPLGKILGSAIGHTVNITDVETDERIKCLHDNCVKVWSTDGQPVRELSQNGYFRSCSFHPRYPNTLVIGGYETITLWNFVENKVEPVQAHGCIVSDLDGCLAAGLLASASRDGCVKVWR
ncbi:unnamed protein product [Urochloa decumbens]|uniref:Uncharacterized protein n=1 Tax=Urochloa decumbens TaxID=240449 RepID=A0ABC8X5M3_9POAL